MPNIMSLAHVSEGEEGVFTAGIRATALAQVARAGYTTPLAFIISCTLYETFLDQSGLKHWIDHLYNRVPDTMEGYAEAYAELVKLFSQVQFSGALREEFLEAYESLSIDEQSNMDSIVTNDNQPRVRIIPSPNYQSTKDFSLALQQNLKGEEHFLQGIMKTWLAYFLPELVAERRLKGMDKDDFSVALLIEKEQEVDCSAEGLYTKARAAHPIKVLSYRGVLDTQNKIIKDEHLLAKDPLDVLKTTIRNQEYKIVLGKASGTAQLVELGEQGLNETLHIRTLLEIGRLTKRAHITLEKDVHCYFGIKGEKAWMLSVEPKKTELVHESKDEQQTTSNKIENFPMTTITIPESTEGHEQEHKSANELLEEVPTKEESEELEEILVEPLEQFKQKEEAHIEKSEDTRYNDSTTYDNSTNEGEEGSFFSVDTILEHTEKKIESRPNTAEAELETQIIQEEIPEEQFIPENNIIQEDKERQYTQDIQETKEYDELDELPTNIPNLESETEEKEGLGISFIDDIQTEQADKKISSPTQEHTKEDGETLFDLFTSDNQEEIPILPVAKKEEQIIPPEAAKMAGNIFVRHVANIVKEFQRKGIPILSEREALLLNAFEHRLSQGEEASDAMVGLAWRAQHLINLRD